MEWSGLHSEGIALPISVASCCDACCVMKRILSMLLE